MDKTLFLFVPVVYAILAVTALYVILRKCRTSQVKFKGLGIEITINSKPDVQGNCDDCQVQKSR